MRGVSSTTVLIRSPPWPHGRYDARLHEGRTCDKLSGFSPFPPVRSLGYSSPPTIQLGCLVAEGAGGGERADIMRPHRESGPTSIARGGGGVVRR